MSKDTGATSGQIRFEARRSRVIYYSAGGKGSPPRPPSALRVFRSQINLPAGERARNAGFTLAIRSFSTRMLDLSRTGRAEAVIRTPKINPSEMPDALVQMTKEAGRKQAPSRDYPAAPDKRASNEIKRRRMENKRRRRYKRTR